jgi:hypothetical protein
MNSFIPKTVETDDTLSRKEKLFFAKGKMKIDCLDSKEAVKMAVKKKTA